VAGALIRTTERSTTVCYEAVLLLSLTLRALYERELASYQALLLQVEPKQHPCLEEST